jgi:hypothetical protein
MRKQLLSRAAMIVLCACGVLAQTQQGSSDSFQWSGELVSFDEAGRSATVKARLVNQKAVDELKRFKAGERVLLFWSGYDKYADAIRSVMAFSADKANDRFLTPVELVSTDAPNQYATFKLRVPESSVGMLKSVKAGEWVTVTSPHRSTADAVLAIRPYTASTPTTSD